MPSNSPARSIDAIDVTRSTRAADRWRSALWPLVVALLALGVSACSMGPAQPAGSSGPVGVTAAPAPRATTSPSRPDPSGPSAAPAATPRQTQEPTGAGTPPQPKGVTIKMTRLGSSVKLTLAWEAPRTPGVTITVLGITTCLAEPASPAPGASGPCVVKGMSLPPSAETRIATAPATAGSVSWSWPEWDDVGGAYAQDPRSGSQIYGVVAGASNEAGTSRFTLAGSGVWCAGCTW